MKPTWVQKGSDAAKNILTEWGIYVKNIPFKAFPDLKDVFKRDWPEDSGDDEYIPANPVFKAYEMELSLVYVGGMDTAGDKIRRFCEYMVGAEISLFDEFTGIGVRCRFVSYDEKAFYRRDEDVVQFSVKVKVNNPLSYAIKTAGTFTKTANCALSIYWSDGSKNDYAADQQISKTLTGFGVVSPTKIGRL